MAAVFILIVLAIIGALVYVGLRQDRDVDALSERLLEYGDREMPDSLEEIELSLSFKERVLIPLAERVAGLVIKVTPQKQLDQARTKLELAGQSNANPSSFLLQRVVFLIVGGILGALAGFVWREEGFMMAMIYTVGAAALGYYFPMMSLNGKIKKRQEGIQKALPDALDLLVICVEAGLGFDMAMGKVYEKWDNELALAFGRVLREIQLGRLRREALRDMAERMDVADVNSFTAAIIQADQLGVSMAKILRIQSNQMRIRRRQRAEQKAHQAPIKMLFPLAFLIFPSMFIVLLGPAVLQIMDSGVIGSVF